MTKKLSSFNEVTRPNPLTEGFANLLPQHEAEKRQHADEVWDMLQKSYAKVGGIQGNGFASKEDMIKSIPFWKVGKSMGKVKSVSLYKDKHGRKRVAVATDGSDEGKRRLGEMVAKDYDRSYGEMSGPALRFTKRQLPEGQLTHHALPYHEVEHIAKLNGEEIRRPPDDDEEIKAHPELKDHFYQRKIGAHWHTKAMFGTPGKSIF